ncbi:histidine kinase dimerization/phospho-acceptor domain-containing protein [Pseudomonas aeruginosa]|uniref:histidine kinase dimerization/phospho-acceptor domain-containing protein n=1 Tax=Pseudomonas aeruginosa TaxID=287 RepID=UPI003D9C2243
MNGVLGMLQLLENHRADPRIAEYTALATESTEHLLKVNNDILDFSRDRTRRAGIGVHPLQPAGAGAKLRPGVPAQRPATRTGAGIADPGRPGESGSLRRSDAPPTDPGESAGQCAEVHRGRLHSSQPGVAGARSRRLRG